MNARSLVAVPARRSREDSCARGRPVVGHVAPLRGRRAHRLVGRRGRAPRRRRRPPSRLRGRPSEWARFARDQAVFLTSHFEALQPRWTGSSHRLATAYLHGRPGTAGYPEFDRAFETLRAAPDRFARIQVTHAEMRDLVLEAGVRASAVHTIPIGIDIEHFPLVTPKRRAAARTSLGLPADAFVVGSFQKDGVGWADGLEPKLIKGPDVLVAALQTGPCRRSRAPRPPHGPGSRLRSPRARAARDPVQPRAGDESRRARPGVPRDRRVRRPGTPGGRPEGGARGDGVRHSARHDPRRAGPGARRARHERLARRRRRRGVPRALDGPDPQRRGRTCRRSGPCDGRAERPRAARLGVGCAPRRLRGARSA